MGISKIEQEEKRKLAFAMKMRDQKEKAQHLVELNRKNYCPRCFILKTKFNTCSMGCDDE